MPNKLTPPPPTGIGILDRWLALLWRLLTGAGEIQWDQVSKAGSNLTEIETRNHNDLQTIQGGASNDYYHLTLVQHTDLTDGGQTSLHKHDHAAQDNLNSANYTHLTAANHTDLTDGGLTDLHRHTADDVELERIGASTYSHVQHLQNLFHSSGYISGGAVTDNGDGTVAIAAGTGAIRTSDSEVATVKFFDFAAVASQALTNGSLNWVYIDYNAGAPVVTASTTEPPNHHVYVKLATVYRDGTDLHINQTVRYNVGDHAANMVWQMQEVMPYAHVSGASISETGTRNLAITAGAFWNGLNRFTTTALDTAVSGSFSTYYRDGVGGFTHTTGQTQVNNTQYDDGSGTLASLSAFRYTNRWVYLATDSDVHVIYGQSQAVALADIQEEQPPSSLPAEIQNDSFLIGRIIIRQGTATFIQVDSAFDVTFSTSGVSNHNDLSGLQGGTTNEYYHLTSAQYTNNALKTDKLSAFAATTSAELAGVISDETGSGALVFATSPTLVTPVLGTPSSGTLTSCTGLPISSGVSGLGTGVATFLGNPTSDNLAAALTDETGSGGGFVRATSPTLVTPTLGVATATTLNKVTITAPAVGSTLTVADGKTLTASNTLTLTGTDGSSVAFGSGGTVAYTANKLSAFAATTSAELAGVISDETGSGALVFASSPTITEPTISSGNMTFSGLAQRILGDFSNATLSNRLAYQTSTTNANTQVGFLPNGTATQAVMSAFASSDASNANIAQLVSNNTSASLRAVAVGTATPVPLELYSNATLRIGIDATNGHTTPGSDNTQNFGSGGMRWKEIFAGNATINTSDQRDKTPVRALSGAEMTVAKQLSSEVGIYQWLAAIEEKGDGARLHAGMTVQRAIEIFVSNGLDPFRYGLVCYDEWEEKTTSEEAEADDPDAVIDGTKQVQKTEKQIRYRKEVEVINGVATLVSKADEYDAPVFNLLPVFDESGEPVMKGDEQVSYKVPVMIDVPRYVKRTHTPAGNRYGFRGNEVLLLMAAGFNARLNDLEGLQ